MRCAIVRTRPGQWAASVRVMPKVEASLDQRLAQVYDSAAFTSPEPLYFGQVG